MTPTPQPARTLTTYVVVVLLVGCVVLTLCRLVGPDQHLAVLVASFGALGLPAYVVLAVVTAVLLLTGARRRVLLGGALAVALVGTTLHAAWAAPTWVGGDASAEPDLVVATLNLQFGGADTDEVATWLVDRSPDVAVLTEATPEALARLEADPRVGAPGEGDWPFRAGQPLPQAAGTVVLSALELGPERAVPLGNRGWSMTVAAPDPVGSFTLVAAHPAYPLVGLDPWRSDLRTLADEVASVDGPPVVVGDLNSTLDHRALREVLAAGPGAGLRDAAEQAGSGWQPTWPAPGAETAYGLEVPVAVLALDHVLVPPGLTAVATSTQQVTGTDHLALVADLVATRTLGRR